MLRGLAERLQHVTLADQQQPVLKAARTAVLSLSAAPLRPLAAGSSSQVPAESGAAATPATWPPLDGQLAEAALQLLLACHSTADLQAASGSGGLDAEALLEEGGRALMTGLCVHSTPLTPAVCKLLAGALCRAPDLYSWATDRFGEEAVDAIVSPVTGVGAAPVLELRKQADVPQPEGVLALVWAA